MLTQRKKTKKLFFNHLIILDIEGFKCGKKPLIIKELSVCSANTIDTFHFLPNISAINFYTVFVGTKVNTLTDTWFKLLTAFV